MKMFCCFVFLCCIFRQSNSSLLCHFPTLHFVSILFWMEGGDGATRGNEEIPPLWK